MKAMSVVRFTRLLAAVAIASAACFGFAQTQFDVPGATEIYPTAITVTGATAGYYATTAPVAGFGKDFYGFIRDSSGNITTFATAAWAPNNSSTVVWGMNSSGVVVGEGYVVGLATKGYIRNINGSFVTINPANSSVSSAKAINDAGQVTGWWNTGAPSYQSHGFIYSGGALISFDVPNPSKTVTTTETNPSSIDAFGNVAGTFTDSNNVQRVFVRTIKGKYATYDIPGSQSIIVTRLNSSGVIGGRIWNGTAQIGFTLTPGKKAPTLTTFSSPYAVGNTSPNDLNNHAVAAGSYWDGTANHGFRWSSSAGFTYFDMPSATATTPLGLNDNGVTTGFFLDSLGALHGFIY